MGPSVRSFGQFFGRPVFYLFCCPDLALRKSLLMDQLVWKIYISILGQKASRTTRGLHPYYCAIIPSPAIFCRIQKISPSPDVLRCDGDLASPFFGLMDYSLSPPSPSFLTAFVALLCGHPQRSQGPRACAWWSEIKHNHY